MSDAGPDIKRKLGNASDLRSVVRTMKALAASNIGQFEKAVESLAEYSHAVELGIGVCLRARTTSSIQEVVQSEKNITAIVFGSDQGLVGQFNDVVAEFAKTNLEPHATKIQIWSVGERTHSRLVSAGVTPTELFEVPNSVKSITALITQILVRYESNAVDSELYLFHNQATAGTLYAPVSLKLLPLDKVWEKDMLEVAWPTKYLPQVMGVETLHALIREYLFISMFRACAESLKAENASRLASMQRADKNIGELIEKLTSTFNHLRQSQIDEELFDVVADYENMKKF